MKGINATVDNGMWKGNAVGKLALHEWVRNHLPQPDFCEVCNLKPSLDLANVTGLYNREFENWKYLCRTCHMKSDGRLDLIHRSRPSPFKGIPSNRIPWNKGKKNPYTEETLRSMSIAKKGKTLSLEHRKHLSESHRKK